MLFNPFPKMKFFVFFGLLALASANKINKVVVKVDEGMVTLGEIRLVVKGQVRDTHTSK